MWVNGTYIPKSHPLWRAGRYRDFGEAAFASLTRADNKDQSGDIYIITNPAWPEWIKVGMARVSAADRCNGYQTGSPFRDYRVEWTMTMTDCGKAESWAHRAIAQWAEQRNEWFKISAQNAITIIEGDMNVQGLAKIPVDAVAGGLPAQGSGRHRTKDQDTDTGDLPGSDLGQCAQGEVRHTEAYGG
jgi:hypothetical protein